MQKDVEGDEHLYVDKMLLGSQYIMKSGQVSHMPNDSEYGLSARREQMSIPFKYRVAKLDS
jgi:hypothetical protein